MKKKILSAVLTLALCTSLAPASFATTDTANDITHTRTNEVALRLGILGDAHIQSSDTYDNPSKDGGIYWTKEALAAMTTLGANQLDAMFITGDMVYQTSANFESHYQQMYKTFNAYGIGIDNNEDGNDEIPVIYTIGNHEFMMNDKNATTVQESIDIFKEQTGQEMNYHTEVNGYHMITAGIENYYGAKAQETEEWLMKTIDAAIAEDSTNANEDRTFDEGVIPNSKKPVFVGIHHPVDKTIFNYTTTEYTSDEFEAYLRTRPQIINLTAHVHAPAALPLTIFQDGYTAFQTPLTAIGSMSEVNCVQTESVYFHEGSMLEVEKDGVVKIYKYNLKTKKYIGEPWVIDIPNMVADRIDADTSNDNDHFLYSVEKREASVAPEFPVGEELIVYQPENGLKVIYPNTAVPTPTANQQDNFVRAYKVKLLNSDGTVLYDKNWQTDFYMDTPSKLYNITFTGLGYNAPYTVEVYPMNAFGKLGVPLTKTVTTPSETVASNALRYEFEEQYTDYDATNTPYASKGKMLLSAQGGIVSAKPANCTSDPSFEFEVTLPGDASTTSSYQIDYVIGYTNSTGNLSKVTISVDDTQLGVNNEKTWYDDMSQMNQFPWSSGIFMKKYRKSLELAGGTHKVKVDVANCQNKELYLFALDYIQFTPAPVIPEDKTVASLVRDDNGVFDGVVVSSGAQGVEGDVTNVGSLENIIDGSTKSRSDSKQWYSNWSLNYPYVQIDLGKIQHISQITYLPFSNSSCSETSGSYWRNEFEIQLSNYSDFRTYTIPFKQDGDLGYDVTAEVNLDPTVYKYRYVRLYKNAGSNNAVLGVDEIGVFGYELSEEEYSDVTVSSVNFTSTPTEVTNVNSTELIEINFSEEIDVASSTSDNIYLLDANGDRITVNPIVIDNDTVAIYPGELSQYTTYSLVVTDVLDKEGAPIKEYRTTDTFKTGVIVADKYTAGAQIKNIALNKYAYKTDGKDGTTPVELTGWLDGTQGSYTAPGNKVESGYYGVIDLGTQCEIKGVGAFYNSTSPWHLYVADVYGTNDISKGLEGATKLGTFNSTLARKGAKPTLNVSGNYQYIILSKTSADPLYLFETYVYAKSVTEDMVENVSIQDGTNGLTNVANAKVVNPWGSDGAKTKTYDGGKPIEIKFTDKVDMSVVNQNTVKLSKYNGSELTSVAYTPILDVENRTLKIDLSDLESYIGALSNTSLSNMYYQIDITNGIQSADALTSAIPETIKFTTNQIAKAPYVEGKQIKNVALGKSARYMTDDARAYNNTGNAADASLGLGRYTTQYTNGSVGVITTDNDKNTGKGITEGNTNARVIKSTNPLLIDLGTRYKVVALAAVTGNWTYHYWNVSHYLTNTETYDNTGLTSVWNTNKTSAVNYGAAVTSEEATRYLLVRVGDTYPDSNTWQYPYEIMAYAYVDADEADDIFFTSPDSLAADGETVVETITAKAEGSGTNTLILAAYKDGELQNVDSMVCENGKAELSIQKTDGITYKAFLWDSLIGLQPITDSIEY